MADENHEDIIYFWLHECFDKSKYRLKKEIKKSSLKKDKES